MSNRALSRQPSSVDQIKNQAKLDPEAAYRRAGYAGELHRRGPLLVGLCELHSESTPSFTIYPDGGFKCFGCSERGDVIAFYQCRHKATFREALAALDDRRETYVRSGPPLTNSARRPFTQPEPVELTPIPTEAADDCHRQLLANQKALDWLLRLKGLPETTLKDFCIGLSRAHWREPRFTIPIPCLDGSPGFCDIRGYRPGGNPKMLPWARGRGRPTLYPWTRMRGSDWLCWVEGEIDCLNLIARGIPAVTATCGVDGATGSRLAIPDLAGREVLVLGDHDAAGRRLGDQLPARLYEAGADKVIVLSWPDTLPDGQPLPQGYDLSDWFASGATREAAWRLIGRE